MSHTGFARYADGGSDDDRRCGNEFGSLHDLIMWLLRHRPNPPDPDPFVRELTQVAEGLQKFVIAAGISDARVRGALAGEAVKMTESALTSAGNTLQQKQAA